MLSTNFVWMIPQKTILEKLIHKQKNKSHFSDQTYTLGQRPEQDRWKDMQRFIKVKQHTKKGEYSKLTKTVE